VTSAIRVRTIDPRGQRFGAGFSAIVVSFAIVAAQPLVALLVGIALAISAARGTQWFLFGRPWPSIRRALRLGAPASVEPELGPRFAQALGAIFIAIGLALMAAGARPWGWAPIVAVAGLQTVLAVSGYCLGCKLYGLHWFLPAVFDRFILRLPAERSVRLRNPGPG
jgi:hypothetical protein